MSHKNVKLTMLH